MSHSLQRQRRLLAVRSLQADFAAAEVRRSQMAESEINHELQASRLAARPDFGLVLSHPTGSAAWLLTCAEQELAGIKIDLKTQQLQDIEERTAVLQKQESLARQERDQIKKVCERLREEANYKEQIAEQAMLDDLFTAGYVLRQQAMQRSAK